MGDKIKKWWIRKLFRLAFFFGKQEHFYGRLMFITLIIGTTLVYFEYQKWGLYFLYAAIICWLIYFFSHNIEKYFHNKAHKRN